MFTPLTRLGLWRSSGDLHMMDLESAIQDSSEMLKYLLGDDGARPRPPVWRIQELVHGDNYWVGNELFLCNYGAVHAHRYWSETREMHPLAPWFQWAQKEIRLEGWPYSRPDWSLDTNVLRQDRQVLVNMHPAWYAPIFNMKPAEKSEI